MPENF